MLNKKKSFWEENKYIIYSFLATAGTMFIIFACNKMVPFGDKTILRMDLYHQYGPLFAELYERVMSGASLTYSWISGIGSCFLGNFFNYLSSPITAIILFFGHENIPEAIAAMILIKAALSSATFTYYLKRSVRSQSYAATAFGILYAFCGYMLAYYWNVMWLDAMVLLPIVVLGIERIINHGKSATYIVGLSLTMLSNYYMSYMLCLFSVIYFIHYYITNNSSGALVNPRSLKKGFIAKLGNRKFLRSGTIFAFASFAAAGIMACVLLPVFNILQSSSATSGSFPEEAETYFNLFDFFANHLGALTTTIRSSGDDVLPNIYCGVLTIILAPLFFLTRSISKKEKVTTIVLLATLYVTFNLNFFNYIWHGFHFPNDLPYRQSFIYSFILLVMAYKTFIRLHEFKARQIGVVGMALFAFVVLTEELTSKNVKTATILLTSVLIVLYVLVLAIFKDKKYQTVSVAALLIVCVCSEAVMCNTSALHISVDKTPYVSDLSEFNEIKEQLDTIEDDGFYRMELTDLRTRMDPSWYYYNGVSVFSSMATELLANLQDDLGMMSNRINSYTYNPQTPVYNMMFSLKYIVNNESPNILSSAYYTSVAKNDTFEAYKNRYCLPIAYCVDSSVAEWATEEYISDWQLNTSSDPFVLQGDYFSRATGLKSPFERLEIDYITYSNIKPFTESLDASSFYYSKENTDTNGSTTFYINTEKAGNVYIYFDVTGENSDNITVSSSLGTITHSADQECILDLGRYAENETISITIPFGSDNGSLKLMAYTLNDKTFRKGYEKFTEGQIITETFNDNYIKGKVVTTYDGLLYTSIPYDKGWNVYIDGEKVSEEDIVKVGQALLGVNITKGSHTVEFRYTVPGLTAGLKISIFTLCIIAVCLILSYLRRKKKIRTLLPCYPKMSDYYVDDVFLPVRKKAPDITVTDVDKPAAADIVKVSSLPHKEIIAPEKKIEKEIFKP